MIEDNGTPCKASWVHKIVLAQVGSDLEFLLRVSALRWMVEYGSEH